MRLLQLCSLLAPSPIPAFMFSPEVRLSGPPELMRLLEDRTRLNMAIRSLTRDSLARFDRKTERVSVHPLLAATVLHTMSSEERSFLAECASGMQAYSEVVRGEDRRLPRA
ncbi:DUF7779 domain-containing protein [Nocardiopsis exhalans]|uniref:DUF7779 domain-containing protein n=1 Tax=Nocardiopsis exhalans TaxID=163604 RepID=UPI003F4D9762